MFVRKKTTKKNPNTYIQLVQSYRVEGKVRQRVIKHIGTATNDVELNAMIKIAEEIKLLYSKGYTEEAIDQYLEKEESKLKGSKSQILNCKEVKRTVTGVHDIYGKIFDEIGLNKVIQSKSNYAQVLRDVVMGRITQPGSKRFTCELLESHFDINHPLNSVYRTMDKLDGNAIAKIQEKIARYTEMLLNGSINVLFFDATSLYFESFTEDELKKLGYSKDGKFNQPQLILTLLVTDKGLPLGYQLFPGNTYEGHTLVSAMQSWKKQYPNNQFVLVADSGLLNNINLTYLEKKEIDYIVCSRIKSLPKKDKEKILSSKAMHEDGKDYYMDLDFQERRLIISYKESRANKDKHDREKAVDRLQTKLKTSKNPASLISNYGYKKYITVDSNSRINLNEEKIVEDSRWDGLHGLITNLKDYSAHEIYNRYRGLWQIEDAFRINKSDLKIRPVFHWTPRRVTAHIAISYMAYSCYKFVEFKVNEQLKQPMSHRNIKSTLLSVEATIFEDERTQNKFFMPSRISDDARNVYQAMNVKLQDEAYCCTLAHS
jgi:transposase